MVGRNYKVAHYTLLHTKYESSGPCGLGKEDYFYVFPMTPPGRGHCTLLHTEYEAFGRVVSEKTCFYFFPIVSLWELMTFGRCHF